MFEFDFLPWSYIAIAVLALLAATFLVILILRSPGGVHGRRGRRLEILEHCEVDKSRTLLLVRRDDTEHLIMIGGSNDLVVEAGVESELDDDVDEEPMPYRNGPQEAVMVRRPPPRQSQQMDPMLLLEDEYDAYDEYHDNAPPEPRAGRQYQQRSRRVAPRLHMVENE